MKLVGYQNIYLLSNLLKSEMCNRKIGFIIIGLFLCIAISAIEGVADFEVKDWVEIPYIAREIDISNAGNGSVNVTIELENPYNFDIAKRIPLQLEFEGINETHDLVVYAKNNSKIIETYSVPIPFRITFKELNITYTLEVGNISKTFTISMPVIPTPKETIIATPTLTPTPAQPGSKPMPAFEAIFALLGFLAAIYLDRQ